MNMDKAILSLDIPPKYRFERKFVLGGSSPREGQQLIRRHPALFRPIYHPRQVNNIYFDTPGLRFFYENQNGVAERQKVRIRWYGELFGEIQKPVLEVKIKHGLIGDKWNFPLPKFSLSAHGKMPNFRALFRQAALPAPLMELLRPLHPTLLNTYRRSYFLSADGHFRLTFDEDMNYYPAGVASRETLRHTFSYKHFVIEVKYAPEQDRAAADISNRFTNRMDKHSKYVNGVEFLMENLLI